MVDRDSTTENVDYRGDGMTVAPKLASLAPPGTIFITADMYSNVMASIERYGGEGLTLYSICHPFSLLNATINLMFQLGTICD